MTMPTNKHKRGGETAAEKAAGAPPSWIEPCLPTLVDRPPTGPNWAHEVKWDGYRLCIVIDRGAAVVRTRRGHDWSHRFKLIAANAAKLLCQNAIIDGEAVVLDEQGLSSFAALQSRLDGESRAQVILYAFDLLFLDGQDLRSLPLKDRRAALEKLIGKPGTSAILLSEEFDVSGETFFKLARERGLEGMVSKRQDLPYQSGRRAEWLKVKVVQSDDFIIVGYQPKGRGGIANLKLAREVDGALNYAGAVGTGFSENTIRSLFNRVDAIKQAQCPVKGLKVKGAIWTRPELRAEVEYRGFTADGELRHASFKGLREDVS